MIKKKNGIIIMILVIIIVIMIREKKKKNALLDKERRLSNKHFLLYQTMCKWLSIKQSQLNIATYLKSNGYNNIAIYGMSYIGELLFKELKDSDVKVEYVIDQNKKNSNGDYKMCSLDDKLADVDAIIVTPIFEFVSIENELRKKMKCSILSFEDIMSDLSN